MNVTVDIGNSKTKVGIFDEGRNLVDTFVYQKFIPSDMQVLLEQYPITHIIVSSVTTIPKWLLALDNVVVLKLADCQIPLTNNYTTPQTLGQDRLAAAVGANYLLPNENVLIVDIGSAITYDLVTANNVFVGGNIAPGIRMRLTSLHEMTHRLPQLQFNDAQSIPIIGQSTQEAMLAGAVRGIIFEMEGYVQALQKQLGSLQVYLTGGHSSALIQYTALPLHHDKNLVLHGLNRILEYNK